MVDTSGAPSFEELVAETLAFLKVEPDGDAYRATAPGWFGDYLFGGFVIAQALVAASQWRLRGAESIPRTPIFSGPSRPGEMSSTTARSSVRDAPSRALG